MIASTSPALTAAENLSSSALIDASSSEAATALDGAKQAVVSRFRLHCRHISKKSG
jgi:hypothetical protein